MFSCMVQILAAYSFGCKVDLELCLGISSGLLPVICEVTQVKRFWFLSKEREPNVFLIIFYVTLGQGLVRRID